MTKTKVVSGRPKSLSLLAIAMFLAHGTLLVAVKAFQATNPLQHSWCSSSLGPMNPVTTSHDNAFCAPSPLRNKGLAGIGYVREQRRGGRKLFVGAVVTPPMNATATNALGGYAERASTTLKTFTRGRKRRAIQKMREKYLSQPVESRFARTLLGPLRMLIWKPIWTAMDVLTNRLIEDETLLFDTDSSIGIVSSIRTDQSASSSTSQAMTTVTTPDMPSAVAKRKKATGSKKRTSKRPKLSITIQKTVKETVKEEDTAILGDRWAVAASGVDLTGKWELVVTDEFKELYDTYLEGLGQPRIVRSVALSGPVIGQTMEELVQIDQGQSLIIRGKNVRGTWDRTLVSSGSTKNSPDFEPLITPIKTIDQEQVDSEAWWEEEGTVHVSWMRGVTMYGGGSFYARRYLEEKKHEDDETIYVCYSAFVFNDPEKGKIDLTWRFRRQK